jgi:DNA mismatch repair ATPase MutL
MLEVVSRAAGEFETYAKTMRAGRELCCGPTSQQRTRQGTAVRVSDFAFTLPVRHAAMVAEAASGALTERVKRRMVALMLAWPEVELLVLDPSGSVLLRLEQVSQLAGHAPCKDQQPPDAV